MAIINNFSKLSAIIEKILTYIGHFALFIWFCHEIEGIIYKIGKGFWWH